MMGRMIDGLWRVLVKFEHPDGGEGWDHTAEAVSYDDCAKLVLVLGLGAPWEVVVDGRAHRVRVTRAMILGPVNAD
jgi:hypothetical protein